jgi:hypothetical protein
LTISIAPARRELMGDAAEPFATDDHITLALFVSRQGGHQTPFHFGPHTKLIRVSVIPIDPRVWKSTDLLHTK